MADKVQSKNKIEAIVISYQDGFTIYHNVSCIRLKGKDINLLVMADYMPTVGEIKGQVEIVLEDNNVRLENIEGFFVVKNNIFKLLIKEDTHVL